MNTTTKKLIENFLNKVKHKYPNLYIECDYDEDDDLYEIWHNDANLEFNDKEFKKVIASIAQEILFDNDVFNFYFGYDHFKTLKLGELHYTLVNSNTSFKAQGKINNFVNSNENNYVYGLIKNRINAYTNNDQKRINLEISNIDIEDTTGEFTMRKSATSKKFNLESNGITQNIGELELAS